MKNHHIKDLLKKEVLIIELPKVCDYDLYADKIYIYDHDEKTSKSIKGSYTLLGKPDEIREEDAIKLVDISFDTPRMYKDYKNNLPGFSATESLLSAIETKVFWDVNPYGNRSPEADLDFPYLADAQRELCSRWHEAELRTFDRSRTLIFVKQ